MCRLRIPNGILTHWQLTAVADIAERSAAATRTSRRAQIFRSARSRRRTAPPLLRPVTDAGHHRQRLRRGQYPQRHRLAHSRHRSPGAARHPALCRAWHHHILNDRALYGLPRKFNVGFDGGGAVPVLEDTNDIGFQAVEVIEGAGLEPGVWFRLALGGITGHKDFARDTGVVVRPEGGDEGRGRRWCACSSTHGDRTNRNKARLKYVLDAWGFEKFLAAVEEKLGCKPLRTGRGAVKPRPTFDRHAHIGVHAQKQPGMNWIGVVLPVGKMTVDADARARRGRAVSSATAIFG